MIGDKDLISIQQARILADHASHRADNRSPVFLPAFRNAHRAALVIVYRDTVPGRFHTKAA